MIVQIYKNIHKTRSAGQSIYSIRDKKSGLVIGHTDKIELKNCVFKISEAGRQRVIKNKRKEVHCVIEGELCNKFKIKHSKSTQIYYNPYKFERFVNCKTGKYIDGAERVLLCDIGVFIK